MDITNDFELTKELDQKYCMQVFDLLPAAFTHGKGVYLYDQEGKKYMDMIGGIAVNSLGHGNKALTKAIKTQADKLIHSCNYYYNINKSELAYKLCKISFADKVFFCNSGAEANEGAIKLARGYFYHKGINRHKIITAKMSFHGRTMGTIAATGQEKFSKPFGPNVPGFEYVPYNDITSLKLAVDGNTAAIMLELIQGESGVRPADYEYVKEVRELCNRLGILLIIDEVQTGVGRTGKMFCYEHYDIKPDIMTLAKGLAGGVPIGALLATEEVATHGFEVGDHGSTFGGNPLACAAGVAVLNEIGEKALLGNVNAVSDLLFSKLSDLKAKYPVIIDVRGKGLLIGIEFAGAVSAKGLKEQLFSMGFLVSSIGDSTIRIAPPLIITEKEASSFIKALETILKGKRKNIFGR